MALLGLLALNGCFDAGARQRQPGLPSDRLFVLPDDGQQTGAAATAGSLSPILSLLRSASRSLALQIYLLTDQEVIDALCAARAAGLPVTVILEPTPYRAEMANQAAYQRLSDAGVDVVWANPRYPLTHTKLLIVDQRQVAIMTANLTRAGLTTNREYLVVSDEPTDVTDALAIVAADRTGGVTPITGGRLVVSPGTARGRLTALLDGARERLDVQMEELSDAAMVASLIAAAGRGVAVTVVAPARDRSAATNGALGRLAAAGVTVRVLESPVVHAKAIVADRRRYYVGSLNLTSSSLGPNREVGILLDDSAGETGAGRVSAVIRADAARGAALPER